MCDMLSVALGYETVIDYGHGRSKEVEPKYNIPTIGLQHIKDGSSIGQAYMHEISVLFEFILRMWSLRCLFYCFLFTKNNLVAYIMRTTHIKHLHVPPSLTLPRTHTHTHTNKLNCIMIALKVYVMPMLPILYLQSAYFLLSKIAHCSAFGSESL